MASLDERENEERVDPRLFEMLEQLRPIPPRDPEAEKRSRARFITEIEALSLPSRSRSPLARLTRRLRYRRNNQAYDINNKEIQMSTPKARFAFTAIMVLIVLMAFLFGGSAITALAAQSALPGDALYPVKMTIEQTRLSLARSAAVRAQLPLEFAERRLGEVEGLIAEGRYQQVSTATVEYESFIKNALAELDLISEMDPPRATELMLQITESLSRYARTLAGMMSIVPEPVKAEMMRSIETIQGVSPQDNLLGETEFTGIVESMGSDTWIIDGRTVRVTLQTEVKEQIQVGDRVKIHAYQDIDGVLIAREIERIQAGGDNANTNENGNGNTNGNSNDNVNGNGNDNQNGNINSNQNTNTNANENANQNQNQNQNENDDGDDDNGNLNDNSNGNENQNDNDDGDDDNGNVNDNGNENENLNQNDNGSDDEDNGNLNDNSNDNENQNQNQNQNDNDDGDDDNGNMNDNSNSNENQNQNQNDNSDGDD